MEEKKTLKIVNFATKKENNYFPILNVGRTDAVPPTRPEWKEIGWKTFYSQRNTVLMMAVFYTETKLDARASFRLNVDNGWISDFVFENAKGFDEENMYNLADANTNHKKMRDAHRYVVALTRYFREINSIEAEKAKEERVIVETGFAAQAKPIIKKTESKKPSRKKESTYDPEAKKPTIYRRNTVETHEPAQRNYSVTEWQRKGFYRHYKSGKTVYIRPTIARRKELIPTE